MNQVVLKELRDLHTPEMNMELQVNAGLEVNNSLRTGHLKEGQKEYVDFGLQGRSQRVLL